MPRCEVVRRCGVMLDDSRGCSRLLGPLQMELDGDSKRKIHKLKFDTHWPVYSNSIRNVLRSNEARGDIVGFEGPHRAVKQTAHITRARASIRVDSNCRR